jgi:hypothetical protein
MKELTATSQEVFKVHNWKLKSLLVYMSPTVCLKDDFMPNYTRASTYDKDIIVCGDLNCNIMNKESTEAQVLNKLCLTVASAFHHSMPFLCLHCKK